MTEQEQEIEQYRAKFRHVVTSDKESLKAWLHSNRHLSVGALAIIAQVPRPTIHKWRKWVGIVIRGQYNPPKNKPIKVPALTPPLPGQSWTEIEWLTNAWELTHSTTEIGKAAKVYKKSVEFKLRQLKIWTPRPPHSCNNKEWLKLHYVDQVNSVRECARLAGVTDVAMRNWLDQAGFIIHPDGQIGHSIRRNRAVRTPLWFKTLANKLGEMTDIVRYSSLQELGVIVSYKTGIKELYFAVPYTGRNRRAFTLTAPDAIYNKHIQIHRQFPVDFNSPEFNHFIINRCDWNDASLIEQRVALHRFQLKQKEVGIMQPYYPDEIIEKCLHRTSTKSYIKNNVFRLYAYPRAPTDIPIIFTYFDLRPGLNRFFYNQYEFLRVLDHITKQKLTKINTENILRYACTKYRYRLLPSDVYRALFEHLGLHQGDTLLDLHPTAGKAIACALMNVKYRTIFKNIAQPDFEKRVALDWERYNGEPISMVFADNEFYWTEIEPILASYAHVAKRIVCFVRPEDRDACEAQFKPSAVIGINIIPHNNIVSHLFIW